MVNGMVAVLLPVGKLINSSRPRSWLRVGCLPFLTDSSKILSVYIMSPKEDLYIYKISHIWGSNMDSLENTHSMRLGHTIKMSWLLDGTSGHLQVGVLVARRSLYLLDGCILYSFFIPTFTEVTPLYWQLGRGRTQFIGYLKEEGGILFNYFVQSYAVGWLEFHFMVHALRLSKWSYFVAGALSVHPTEGCCTTTTMALTSSKVFRRQIFFVVSWLNFTGNRKNTTYPPSLASVQY